MVTKIFRSRYLYAVIAGIALGLAFPNFNVAGLAWIAPGLMIAAAGGTRGWRSFCIGYFAGLAFHLTTLQWLLNIPVRGFPILGWIALSAFLALYQAIWVWLVSGSRSDERAPATDSFFSRLAWALFGAAIWVGLEMIQARFLSGFPWHLLGVSQVKLTPLIQVASITGVYGVSFVVVWTSLSILTAVRVLLARPTERYAWLGELLLPLGAVLGLSAFGMSQLRIGSGDTGKSLRVAFIQPSIPQTMIWNPVENEKRFAQLMQLTAQSLTNRPDLILWPEAAMPGMLRYDEAMATNVLGFARSNAVWLIIGSDDVEPAKHPVQPDDVDSFNASFLINPEGEIAARYCKRNLVMFGEYIPLWRWLSFLKWFTPIEGGFAAGDEVVPFTLQRDGPIQTAISICFEDVFPHHTREYVKSDTAFLVNLTNDGWFGEGGEQWQHANAAIFRAIENRIPLLRACNNGLTCWIDSHGNLREFLRDQGGSIYNAGVLVADIPIAESSGRTDRTFYHRHGDWFGWSCVAVTGVPLLARLRRRRVAA